MSLVRRSREPHLIHLRPITRRILIPTVAASLLVAFTACTTPAGQPTAVPSTSTSTSTSAAPSPSPSSELVLSGTGYGALLLGMTKDEARATGLTAGVTGTKGTCGSKKDGRLSGAPESEGDEILGQLFFSENTGKLVAIYAYGPVAMPKGIKVGSTQAALLAAYPEWKDETDGVKMLGRGYLDAPGGKAVYRIAINDDKVAELSLDSKSQDCYE